MNRFLSWIMTFPTTIRESSFLRALISLGIAILLGDFFYLHGQELDHGQLLDLKLLITLAIVEVPLLMFTPILYNTILNESRKHAEESKRLENKEKHRELIIKQFESPIQLVKLDYNEHLTNDYEDKVYWTKTPIFENFKVHLEKGYPDLYKSYLQLIKDVNALGNPLLTKINEYRNYVREKLSSFTELPEAELISEHYEPIFLKKRLIVEIARNIADLLERRSHQVFTIQAYYSTKLWSLSDSRTSPLALGQEEQLSRLKDLANTIQSEDKLSNLIKEIEKLKKEYNQKGSSLITEFHNKRSPIKDEIEYGKKPLKGDCEWCP